MRASTSAEGEDASMVPHICAVKDAIEGLKFSSGHRSVVCSYPYRQHCSFTTARGRIVSKFAGDWEALTNQSGDRAKAKRQERILADRYKINISTAEDLTSSIEFQ